MLNIAQMHLKAPGYKPGALSFISGLVIDLCAESSSLPTKERICQQVQQSHISLFLNLGQTAC